MTLVRRALVLSLLLFPRHADACAPAPPKGAEVMVAAEEAVIVWDAAKKTEHFIRRAQFQSTAKDFGFLVPTPSAPTLAETTGIVFERAREATKPAVEHKTELEPTFTCLTSMVLRSAAPSAQAPPDVRVLSIQNVAGYEAAILQADDAEKLRGWLEEHGYDARPELTAWMAPYIANKWTITAFKVVGEATASVRMTFQTDAPLFPYREPSDATKKDDPNRVLRVFLISSEKMTGEVGHDKWSADLRFAKFTPTGYLLAAAMPPELAPKEAWLHDFVDTSAKRPGTEDLYFRPAADSTEVTPKPIVETSVNRVYIPLDVAVILGALGYFVVRMVRRPR